MQKLTTIEWDEKIVMNDEEASILKWVWPISIHCTGICLDRRDDSLTNCEGKTGDLQITRCSADFLLHFYKGKGKR
jgi:hypothetical protein